MHTGLRAAVIGSAVVVAAAVVWMRAPAIPGQTAAYRAPRTADGKPDLNGIWQAVNTANYDIQSHAARPALALVPAPPRAAACPAWSEPRRSSLRRRRCVHSARPEEFPPGDGVVEGREIPYQPWAAAKKKENSEHWLERDPEIKCYMPGVPRATYMPYPFQILQGTNKILIAYEFGGTTRTIHMDTVGASPSPTWMGWSRGHWEGETLVVDVTNFNDQTWFDRAGNFHSDALHVVERLRR